MGRATLTTLQLIGVLYNRSVIPRSLDYVRRCFERTHSKHLINELHILDQTVDGECSSELDNSVAMGLDFGQSARK